MASTAALKSSPEGLHQKASYQNSAIHHHIKPSNPMKRLDRGVKVSDLVFVHNRIRSNVNSQSKVFVSKKGKKNRENVLSQTLLRPGCIGFTIVRKILRTLLQIMMRPLKALYFQ